MVREAQLIPTGAYSPWPLGSEPLRRGLISPAPAQPRAAHPPTPADWTCPWDLPRACLTLMGSVGAELSPTPASLTDRTQNSYSFPVLSPGTVNLRETRAAFRDSQTAPRHPACPEQPRGMSANQCGWICGFWASRHPCPRRCKGLEGKGLQILNVGGRWLKDTHFQL